MCFSQVFPSHFSLCRKVSLSFLVSFLSVMFCTFLAIIVLRFRFYCFTGFASIARGTFRFPAEWKLGNVYSIFGLAPNLCTRLCQHVALWSQMTRKAKFLPLFTCSIQSIPWPFPSRLAGRSILALSWRNYSFTRPPLEVRCRRPVPAAWWWWWWWWWWWRSRFHGPWTVRLGVRWGRQQAVVEWWQGWHAGSCHWQRNGSEQGGGGHHRFLTAFVPSNVHRVNVQIAHSRGTVPPPRSDAYGSYPSCNLLLLCLLPKCQHLCPVFFTTNSCGCFHLLLL